MKRIIKNIDKLTVKWNLQRIQIEKEYGSLISTHENLINGCCAMADTKGRMDCIQQFYRDLLLIKKCKINKAKLKTK